MTTDLVPAPSDDPDRVLAERFAGGEIDEDEFTRARAFLHRPAGGE